MAVRKINHVHRILSKKPVRISNTGFKDIIEFKYKSKDVYDKKPMIFILRIKDKILSGININYLKELHINKLLLEDDEKKLKNWLVYKDGFRTYSIKNITQLKLVDFDTLDSKLPKQPEPPKQPEKPRGGK